MPPLLTFLAKSPLIEKYDLSSIVNVGSGAAPISSDVYDACSERFAKRGIHLDTGAGYGLTETSECLNLDFLAATSLTHRTQVGS